MNGVLEDDLSTADEKRRIKNGSREKISEGGRGISISWKRNQYQGNRHRARYALHYASTKWRNEQCSMLSE